MKCRILIIEDNPINLELARELLELSGYEVIEADTAREGIRLARETRPDLILMDVGLPDMDGLAATRRIKADPALTEIPIVALSAHAMARDRELAMEAGCDGYVVKPIDTRKFVEDVAALCSNAGALSGDRTHIH